MPIRLASPNEDLEEINHLQSGMLNDNYKAALKYLRGALHSSPDSPPLLAALLPLIQVLLSGMFFSGRPLIISVSYSYLHFLGNGLLCPAFLMLLFSSQQIKFLVLLPHKESSGSFMVYYLFMLLFSSQQTSF